MKFLLLHKMLDEKIRKSIRKETQELLNVTEEIRLVALSNKKMELTIYGHNHYIIKKVIYHLALKNWTFHLFNLIRRKDYVPDNPVFLIGYNEFSIKYTGS